MKVTLFSTGCPKCRILEAKLKQKGIEYEEVTDVGIMTEKGFMSVPILEVDNSIMDFIAANKWINERN